MLVSLSSEAFCFVHRWQRTAIIPASLMYTSVRRKRHRHFNGEKPLTARLEAGLKRAFCAVGKLRDSYQLLKQYTPSFLETWSGRTLARGDFLLNTMSLWTEMCIADMRVRMCYEYSTICPETGSVECVHATAPGSVVQTRFSQSQYSILVSNQQQYVIILYVSSWAGNHQRS